jgi:hypothetical protein
MIIISAAITSSSSSSSPVPLENDLIIFMIMLILVIGIGTMVHIDLVLSAGMVQTAPRQREAANQGEIRTKECPQGIIARLCCRSGQPGPLAGSPGFRK